MFGFHSQLNSYRRRIDALKRKLAPELQAVRLRRMAEQYCCLWDCAVRYRSLPPGGLAFIQRIAKAGFRLQETFPRLYKYLECCYHQEERPTPGDIVSSLLPWTAAKSRL